jgi:hypothetical protein
LPTDGFSKDRPTPQKTTTINADTQIMFRLTITLTTANKPVCSFSDSR